MSRAATSPYYEDLNYQEIAAALETTPKAVERLLPGDANICGASSEAGKTFFLSDGGFSVFSR